MAACNLRNARNGASTSSGPEATARGGAEARAKAINNDLKAGHNQWIKVSGIYPHLATFNDTGARNSYGECGIGAIVPWAGSLWYLTYPPHERAGSADKLYQLDPSLNLTVRAESVGGTHAGRLIHRESQQLVIGPYFIDTNANVRAIDINKIPGRLTAVARHLVSPADKIYYFDMEGPIWEVDVQTLTGQRVFVKPMPGWHGKGAYTAQGRLVIANNGEHSAASDIDNLKWELPVAQWSKAPEDAGVLAEYDGNTWSVISRRQHTEVTGPGGLKGEDKPTDPIWSLGWDKRSVLLQVRHDDRWTTYRVPKGSYTYDPRHGWFTEWPRIREIGEGRFLMNMHGTFFDFPPHFRPGHTAALRPLSTHLAYVPDFALWNGGLVLGNDDNSITHNPLGGRSQSNLRFISPSQLDKDFGPALGWGGPWVNDKVKAKTPSDPLLIAGYPWRTLHLAHTDERAVTFALEVDEHGDGGFYLWKSVLVPGRGYVPVALPEHLKAPWLRVYTDRDAVATAYMHAGTPPATTAAPGLDGLATIATRGGYRASLLRAAPFSRDLQLSTHTVAADGSLGPELYYEINEKMQFRRLDAPKKLRELHVAADPKREFEVDAASVIVRSNGKRWRLPKGPAAFDATTGTELRGLREVTSQRYLANFHGSFYEVPRNDNDERPNYARIKPIASHALRITDFASWRGLLVLAGVSTNAAADGHVFRSDDGDAALWFGAVDDLYRLGHPVGEGGPWHNTAVEAGVASDPYLMTAYGHKTLVLSHDGADAVAFTVEVDPLADGGWLPYTTLTTPPGRPLKHVFPTGFAAHWIRFTASRACRATATLRYE